MDSLIYLDNLCPSLLIILKLLWLMGWLVWLLWWWMGKGSFRCSLYLSPKVLEVSLCIHHHRQGPHIDTNRWHHFGRPWGLCPWGRPGGFWWCCHLWSEFGCHTFTKTLCVGYDYVPLTHNFFGGSRGTVSTLAVNPINGLTGRPVMSFLHLVPSPFGIFALGESFPEVFFSCLSNAGLLHTVLALWEGVLITLNLAERLWWLSHCRYWSVWVHFLYTVIDRPPSSSGFTNGVQEGDGTILLIVLHCKFYGRINTVNVLKEVLFVGFLVDDKGVIHKPAPEPGGWGAVLRAFCSKYSM